MGNLHSDWAPSSMGRIIPCPASVEVSKLYEREEGEAANLGTIAHGVLEDTLVFGVPVEHDDIEIVEGVQLAVDFATQEALKGGNQHIEVRLSLKDTPVWGTADIVHVHNRFLHIIDYKHGYLPVEVESNAQLLTYLLGAIERFGERDEYHITIIQPRYLHADGPIRTCSVSSEEVAKFRERLNDALANPDRFRAGKHCKYCPARGGCKTLAAYLAPKAASALFYDLTDKHAVDNDTLASLLDMAELLPGWVSELRAEGLRRTFADRRVPGYKVVNGQQIRDWEDTAESELPVIYAELGIPAEALYESKFVSPATAEKQVKGAFKGQKRGAWKLPWERVQALIKAKSQPPVLVRDIDGRPPFRKGTEFGKLNVDDDGDILA